MGKPRSKAAYMISAVAEQYNIHPQTLRLAELLQWFEGERAADAGRHLRPRFYD